MFQDIRKRCTTSCGCDVNGSGAGGSPMTLMMVLVGGEGWGSGRTWKLEVGRKETWTPWVCWPMTPAGTAPNPSSQCKSAANEAPGGAWDASVTPQVLYHPLPLGPSLPRWQEGCVACLALLTPFQEVGGSRQAEVSLHLPPWAAAFSLYPALPQSASS